jgi:hypothetical protein
MVAIPSIDRDPTLEAVDAALEAGENAQPPRAYLGMSEIGRECARALWYGFRWCTRKGFDAATIRRFQDGHRAEAIMIERLRAVPGIQLWTEDPSGNGLQIGCADIGGHFRGHLDGVILGLLQAPKTPHVFEHKATNEKKQAKLFALKAEKGEKHALAEWDPVYFAQAQLYMHYQELSRHYLTCDSPGSRSTVSCRTDADPTAAHALIEKARRIITAAEPPARLSDRPDWFACQWCTHKATCHEGRIPEVSCRTCAHATPELDGAGRWTCARFGCDLSLETQRQSAACPDHVFIPAMLPWPAIDASEDQGWIEYQLPNDHRLRNGPRICGIESWCYTSAELATNAGLCVAGLGDPAFRAIRDGFGAEVVG